MLKGIPHRLTCNPIDLIPDDRIQWPYGSLHVHPRQIPSRYDLA